MMRSNDNDYEFSLFPFMGVLAGVIGVLVLVISGLAIIGMSRSNVVVELLGNPKDRAPVCVECAKDVVIIHSEDGRTVIREFAKTSGDLRPLLDELSDYANTEFLVLLIRPDAIDTFTCVEQMVKEYGIEYGYDALLSNEKVKISS